MTLGSLLRALRFDGLWWRKFAYLGSVYGPEWWKRWSPPWVAAIIFLCVGRNRRGAVANMRRVLGRRGWLRDHLAALDVFIAFAHCMNETLEYFSPRPQPVRVDEPTDDPIKAAITRGRGAVLVTCHFGNWDIGARTLARFGCPFNLVMAREANETTADYVRKAREDAGVRVLLSDSSVYGSFNMLRALKRNEVVAMQLDRPLGGDGARSIEFFGAPALFPSRPAPARASRRRADLPGLRAPRRRRATTASSSAPSAPSRGTRASRRWIASSPASSPSSSSWCASTPSSGSSSRRTGRRTRPRGLSDPAITVLQMTNRPARAPRR